MRIFQIFGSQFAAAAGANRRPSSRVFIRVSRRLAAISLSSNAIVLSFWTISGRWHSDAASRLRQSTQPCSWCHSASSQINGCSERSRVTHLPRNASGRTVLVNFIYFFGDCINYFFCDVCLVQWGNMCDVPSPFPSRSCWGSAVGGTWWVRCMGETLTPKAGHVTAVCGLWPCHTGLACL